MSDAVDKTLSAKLGVGLPELQVTFSLLIILQTFFSLFRAVSGKFGPRRLIAIGTVMAGMSWVLSAQVNGRQRSGWFMAAWAASGPGSSTSALSA